LKKIKLLWTPYLNELDILLSTISDWPIGDWQKDSRISGGGIVHLSTSIVVKQWNGEAGKITPSSLEVAGPITKDAIDDGAQIELGAESVKHHTMINARGGEGSLVDLEGVGALRRLHCRVGNGVKRGGYLVNLDWLEGPGNKHIVRLRGGGTGHGNGRVIAA